MVRKGLLGLCLAVCACAQDYTALDRYVAAPDPAYKYTLVNSLAVQGVKVFVLDMTSQTWLTTAEVNRAEWKHKLTIIKPDTLKTNTVLMLINGGSNPPSFTSLPDLNLVGAALESGAIVASIDEIPNEPLTFTGETKSRTEDGIIAYSWKKFMETGDEKWPLRLPMTKGSVRAIDAITDFLASDAGGKTTVGPFIVTGGSKRGWTTWTTAAVDPRVIAIAPMVIDILNVPASFVHHWRAYGFCSPAIQDYVDAGVMNWLGTPQFEKLMDIEDPYRYMGRWGLPKYLINSSGDQFFLPDSAQFYFKDLPGEKYLRYVPNTDHGLDSPDTMLNLLAWFQAQISNTPRPRFYWTPDRANGTITLRTLDKPTKVMLWQASNPNARDFRLMTIGKAWTSSPVEGDKGIYTVAMPKPAQGYTAFFLELTYEGRGKYPLVFTTEVVVTPDVYPFAAPVPATVPTSLEAARKSR